MNHAILGVGGVGGLMAALLSQAGNTVTALVRRETLSSHPSEIFLETQSRSWRTPVQCATMLSGRTDVVWIAVKATQLCAALQLVPAKSLGAAVVVPLLNGIDHVPLLRSYFGNDRVIPGTISVDSERVGPGHIIQNSPFARLSFSAVGKQHLEEVVSTVRSAGYDCEFEEDESAMLWRKLSFLAPFALTTSAFGKAKGELFADPGLHSRLESAVAEACMVAAAEQAPMNPDKILARLQAWPSNTRSSMQRDVSAGRIPEVDAIGGPIIRCGAKHDIETPTTRALISLIENRIETDRLGRAPKPM